MKHPTPGEFDALALAKGALGLLKKNAYQERAINRAIKETAGTHLGRDPISAEVQLIKTALDTLIGELCDKIVQNIACQRQAKKRICWQLAFGRALAHYGVMNPSPLSQKLYLLCADSQLTDPPSPQAPSRPSSAFRVRRG